jgi:hypothetical protein
MAEGRDFGGTDWSAAIQWFPPGLKICEERRWFVQEIVGDAVELPAR